MAKPRSRKKPAASMSEKLLFDSDSEVPQHDVICSWIDGNASSIVATILGQPETNVNILATRWEVPLVPKHAKKAAPPGYADVVCWYETNCVQRFREILPGDNTTASWADDVSDNNVRTYVFNDLESLQVLATPKLKVGSSLGGHFAKIKQSVASIDGDVTGNFRSVGVVVFEAKTAIPSAGTLIREINFYRSIVDPNDLSLPFQRIDCAMNPPVWAVVCPDDSHNSLLNRQNISFVKCPVPVLPPERGQQTLSFRPV